MARARLELKGRKFGKLEVVGRLPIKQQGHTYWACKCDCGNIKNVQHTSLVNGKTKTCGDRAKHPLRGKRKKPERYGAVLTPKQVEIRALWGTGTMTQRALAAQFKVSRLAVFNVIHHKTWSDVSRAR